MLDSTSRLYRPSANEIQRIKSEETARRRKMRIQQVRSIAMAHAAYTRKRYFEKQCAVLSKVAHEVQREKTRADIYALQAKQALLDKAVEKLGESHRVASSWEDPEKSEQKKAEKRQLKANERFNAAFLELMTDKAIKEWQASASVRYRVAALETEKKRATAVAALPPPPPAPYCDPSVTDKHANGTACAHCADVQDADNGQKVSVNVIDGDKNCLSGPRPISPPEVVNEKMQISETLLEKQPTAFDSAIEEEARLKEVDQGRLIQAVEESVKAEVRGQSAMRRARVQQHYDSLLRRLDEIARVDVRDHQRHLASSMALYSAAGEGSEALEKKRERAFEKELRQQMLQEPQKELPQQMPLEPKHESDSATVTETLVDLDGDSEVVAAELTAPSVHQADLPVRNRSPEPPLQVPEIGGEQTQTLSATVSTENSPACPIASSLGQEHISAENLNNQSFSYSKRGPSAGIRLAARLPPSADVTSHTPAFLSRMGPGDRPEMTDFRHYLHIPTVDTDTLSIQKLQEQLNQYFRTRSTIGDHSRFSDAFDFEREKEKLDMQVAEIDRQIEALHQSALARQCRLQDEGRRLTTGTVMDGERPVAFLPSSNELPAQTNEPCVTEVSGGSFTLSPTLSTSFASTVDHSPLRTATSAQVISSEKRDKARQLIKQQQTSSQVRLTSVSKKPRVTISPAQKTVALGICPSQTTASGTTNVVVLDRNSTASRPAKKAARLSARPSALVNVVVANTGHDAASLPPASSKDSGRPTHICPSVRPTTTLSYELPQAVIFHPSAKILDESEDVSDLTHVTSPEPSLLSLGRTVCRAVSPVSAPETGFELTGSGSHHEAEPIRLKATASTFVVAKTCSPITKRADEKPVPHFQQPLTCSVSTPPEVEDIDKSTSEVSYYSPQTNRMPSHFGVAKVASPNMRYAASDNRTLEVFVSGTSPDLRRSSLTIEGHPFGIECENKEDCQWPPPPSPIVVSPPAVQLEVGESTRLNTGSCDGIFSGAINLKSETEGVKASPCAVLRKSCPGLFSTNQALHNSSPTLDSPFPTTGCMPKLVTQSATTSQDGLYPCASRSTNRRNTMSSLTLDRRIQPICAPGEGRPLSISHPDLYRTKVQPQPVISESLGRSLGNLLTAPPAISSHCPSPLTSPRRFVTKARPQVTLTSPHLHVPNIHSPAINTTTSVPIAEMAKAPWTTVYLDTAHRPSSPELAQAPSVTQHSLDPDREPGACVVPKIPGIDQQSPRPLLTSRVGSYPSSRLLSGQSAPPPDAVGESLGSSRLTHRSSSNGSLSDVGVPTLKLYADRGAPPAEAAMYHPQSRRTVHRNQSCSVHVPHLLATDRMHMAQPHGGDLRSSSSGSPSLYEDVRTIHHTVADRKQAILKEYLQKNLDGLIDHATTRTSSLTIEESSSTSLPSQLISTSKTIPTSDELSSKLSSLTVSSLLPLSTSIRDIPSDVDITSPSSPSTAFHTLPNSGSPADSSPDSPFAATWPGRTLVQRNNNNQQNTVLLSKHPIHLALPTRIHRGSPWYQTHRMQFRQLSVVEEASEVDGVLMKGETLCVYSPERLENQQLMSSPSLPASTPASSSRPSDQFSCLSMSVAPETETKETNRGLTTTTTPLSRGSAGDGATGSLCSSELTTLRYLHDVPYTPKSPTMDKSESAVSITDTSFLTPYVTAVSVSQREHSNPVSLNSSAATNRQLAVGTASDNGVSTSVGLSYDSATQGLVSLSSGCVEGSSVRRIDNEPTHRMQFRQLSVVEEASEVDGVLMKGETLCVYSPERLENQQLLSSPSLPASTPASSSRPSDQFSCLSMSAAPETETKETNRGLTTTTTPLSRGSAGDGATGSLCSSELTTLRYLHDVPYTPKSPTMDKSESAVSITDTSFLTPYVTAASVSQREHSNPVSLNSSAATNRQLAVVTASDNGVSTSVGLSYDSATQGLVSLSSGCVEGSSVRRIYNEPPPKSPAGSSPPQLEDGDITFTELSVHIEDQRLEGDGTETSDPSPTNVTRLASSASLLSFLRHEQSCSSSLEAYSGLRDVTPCLVPLSQSSTSLPVDADGTFYDSAQCTNKPLARSAILLSAPSNLADTNPENTLRATVTAGGQVMEAPPAEPNTPKLTDSEIPAARKQLANKAGAALWGRLLNGTIASRARQRAIQAELKKSGTSSRQIPKIRISMHNSRLKEPFELKAVECNRTLECAVEKTTNWGILRSSHRTMNPKPTDFLTPPPNLLLNRNRPVTPVRAQSPLRHKVESETRDVGLLESCLAKNKSDSLNVSCSKVVAPGVSSKKVKGLVEHSRNTKDPYLVSVSPRTSASNTSHPKPAGSLDSKKRKKSPPGSNILISNALLPREASDLPTKDLKVTNPASVKPSEKNVKRTSSQPSSRFSSVGSNSSRSKQNCNYEKSAERLRKEEAARSNRERVRQFDRARREKMAHRTVLADS